MAVEGDLKPRRRRQSRCIGDHHSFDYFRVPGAGRIRGHAEKELSVLVARSDTPLHPTGVPLLL